MFLVTGPTGSGKSTTQEAMFYPSIFQFAKRKKQKIG
jgi:type II secretory ATPase GspE/PulE/Tfp pilus assembly ATPase PilB-like protein